MRVPDNGYRYREDAPIEEYFQNWGRVLGQMQALTKRYQPLSDQVKRPEWFEIHDRDLEIAARVPDRLPIVRDRIQSLLGEIRALPRDKDAYGLIHGDFNDGNFTVDYTNGDITVFDFDDSCYLNFVQNNPGSIRPMQNEGDSIPAMQNNRGSNPKNVANRQVDPRRRVRTLTI